MDTNHSTTAGPSSRKSIISVCHASRYLPQHTSERAPRSVDINDDLDYKGFRVQGCAFLSRATHYEHPYSIAHPLQWHTLFLQLNKLLFFSASRRHAFGRIEDGPVTTASGGGWGRTRGMPAGLRARPTRTAGSGRRLGLAPSTSEGGTSNTPE